MTIKTNRKYVYRRIRLDPAIVEAIESIAYKEGVSFSHMFNKVLLDVLYDSHKGNYVRQITEKLYRAKVRETAAKIAVYRELIETLEQLEKEVLNEVRSTIHKIELYELEPFFDTLIKFFDEYGLDYELAKVKCYKEIAFIDEYFKRNYRKDFNIKEFAEMVWLHERSYEEYLDKVRFENEEVFRIEDVEEVMNVEED